MTIGQLLRDARDRHGATQAQLAARARTSQAAISRIERDRVSPTIETARELFGLLGEELRITSEPVESGHDRTLLRQNLALSPEDRIRRQVAWANRVRTLPRVR
jgi:transcriptional regulator with XRE-family HTH domain